MLPIVVKILISSGCIYVTKVLPHLILTHLTTKSLHYYDRAGNLYPALCMQQFGYLYGIGCRSFTQVVSYYPAVKCIRQGIVAAYAAHKYLVLAFCIQGHGVAVLRRVVYHYEA